MFMSHPACGILLQQPEQTDSEKPGTVLKFLLTRKTSLQHCLSGMFQKGPAVLQLFNFRCFYSTIYELVSLSTDCRRGLVRPSHAVREREGHVTGMGTMGTGAISSCNLCFRAYSDPITCKTLPSNESAAVHTQFGRSDNTQFMVAAQIAW